MEPVTEGGNSYTKRVAIPRSGDLLTKCALRLSTASDLSTVMNTVDVTELIDVVSLEIGGTLIDQIPGKFLEWTRNLLHGDTESLHYHHTQEFATQNTPGSIYFPLDFFFTRHSALALPIVALAYHDINVIVKLKDMSTVMVSNAQFEVELVTSSVYLDEAERELQSSTSHEFIIPQIQSTEISFGADALQSTTTSVPLPFNHPVAFLLWGRKDGQSIGIKTSGTAHEGGSGTYQLLLNHHPVFGREMQSESYFSRVVPHCVFKKDIMKPLIAPFQTASGAGAVANNSDVGQMIINSGVCAYSFAVNPTDLRQPSGTVNFSRITDATLQMRVGDDHDAGSLVVYALSYNILSITAGMGGLRFSS